LIWQQCTMNPASASIPSLLSDKPGSPLLTRSAHPAGSGKIPSPLGSPLLSRSTDDLRDVNIEDIELLPPLYDKPVASADNFSVCSDVSPQNSRATLLVMKFGGTSLAGPEELKRAVSIIRDALENRPVVVLSAMGKTTNYLLAAASKALDHGEVDVSVIRATHEQTLRDLGVEVPACVTDLLAELERLLNGVALLREISTQTRDRIVSFGERLSVRTFDAYFNASKDESTPAKYFDSWQLGLRTTSGAGSADSAFSQVEVLPESYDELQRNFAGLRLDYTHVPIVTGYIAQDSKGVITTLGRDGSDLTATVIGVAVQASEVQIWKDVSGIQSIDPRVCALAKPVRILTFEEAAELSTFGAKVVHPAAVLPAWSAGIPMSVRNSMSPELPGTRIVKELQSPRDGHVAAMSSKSGITVIVIRSSRMLGQHGFLAHIFSVFNKFEVSVDVIATSEVTVSLTLDQGYKPIDLASLESALREVATVDVLQNMAMLTLITAKQDSVTVLKESFAVFHDMGVGIEMISHGASNVNVTFVLPGEKLLPVSQKLHEVFFER